MHSRSGEFDSGPINASAISASLILAASLALSGCATLTQSGQIGSLRISIPHDAFAADDKDGPVVQVLARADDGAPIQAAGIILWTRSGDTFDVFETTEKAGGVYVSNITSSIAADVKVDAVDPATLRSAVATAVFKPGPARQIRITATDPNLDRTGNTSSIDARVVDEYGNLISAPKAQMRLSTSLGKIIDSQTNDGTLSAKLISDQPGTATVMAVDTVSGLKHTARVIFDQNLWRAVKVNLPDQPLSMCSPSGEVRETKKVCINAIVEQTADRNKGLTKKIQKQIDRANEIFSNADYLNQCCPKIELTWDKTFNKTAVGLPENANNAQKFFYIATVEPRKRKQECINAYFVVRATDALMIPHAVTDGNQSVQDSFKKVIELLKKKTEELKDKTDKTSTKTKANYAEIVKSIQRYPGILISQGAPGDDLAHEIGHFFGLSHDELDQNDMCKEKMKNGKSVDISDRKYVMYPIVGKTEGMFDACQCRFLREGKKQFDDRKLPFAP